MAESENDNELQKKIALLFDTIGNERLSEQQKHGLWKRIVSFADAPPSQRFWRYRAVAAVVALLLVACGVLFRHLYSQKENPMQRIADQRTLQVSSTELILADNRSVLLDSTETEISYQPADGKVMISSGKRFEQNASGTAAYNTLVVPHGQRAMITLSDGTRVWVNSGSKLVYPVLFPANKREIFLEGEAYFAVTPNKEAPMTVFTREMDVTVLGTAFDICAYPDDRQTYAVLAEGSIELRTGQSSLFTKKKERIIPGEQALFDADSGELRVVPVNVEDYTSWKDGYLILRSAPLKDILKKLSRYYRTAIILEDIPSGEETLSGTLLLQEDLLNAIDIICSTTMLTYGENEKTIILKKKNR